MQMLEESPSAAALRSLLRWLVLGALLLAGCRADQATKAWAKDSVQARPLTVVPQVLEFRYAENPAIAFSMFRDLPDRARVPLIFGLTSLALAALLTLIWNMRRQGAARLVPLALILAGALGNLQDRLAHGYVVDFVYVHWGDRWDFPVFNLADSLITIGTVLLLAEFLFRPASAGRRRPE
jgi:signal peptidase II